MSYVPTSGETGLGVVGKREVSERLKESEDGTEAELGDAYRDDGDPGRKKGNSDTVMGLPCLPSFKYEDIFPRIPEIYLRCLSFLVSSPPSQCSFPNVFPEIYLMTLSSAFEICYLLCTMY